MSASGEEYSDDAFLGGHLTLRQPKAGYRAGVDPVFLAAAVQARAGQTVLDLGCGVGAASFCLGARVPGLLLSGVERQQAYAECARQNATRNKIGLDVHVADLAHLPQSLRARTFDHVIANPPYHLRQKGTLASDAGRERALGEDTLLAIWMDVATRRLAPGGHLTMIQKTERLPELLAALDGRLGSVIVKPLCPREGRAAILVLLQARKGGRGAFRLAAPLILHEGAVHDGDRESYRPDVRAILRNGAALPLE